MKLYDLKTNHQKEYLGLDTSPVFSWKLSSTEHNICQHSYSICLRDEDGKNIWESGEIVSEQSTFVPYDGPDLKSKTAYVWEVTVTDNHGSQATSSAMFETAFMQPGDWKASWVESPFPVKKRKKGFAKQPVPVVFEKLFTLSTMPKKARIYLTCHGIYELRVNGKKPDERFFAPENSSYGDILYYQTYDILPLLQQGDNLISVTVADGWYFSPIATLSSKLLKGKYAVLLQAELTAEDGCVSYICSDESMRATTGKTQCADLYAGEKYDATAEPLSAKAVSVAKYGYDNLRAQPGAPVTVAKILKPVSLTISPKGERILDFGQVTAGVVRMRISAPSGTVVTLYHTEALDLEGNMFYNILSGGGVGGGIDQKIVYVSDGTEQVYTPMFSYQGFRYVAVEGLSEININDFEALVLTTTRDNLGSFCCSDARLNRLYENTRWSQDANMLSIPTDCPQREKAGWTGDISVYAEASLQNDDTSGLLSRWMASVRADQGENGAVPMVVPNSQTYQTLGKVMGLMYKNKGLMGVAGWGDAVINVPFAVYRQTGNMQILRENYMAMKAWCDYILTTAKSQCGDKKMPREYEQYIWNTGFHYGEWLIPSDSPNGIDMKNLKSTIIKGQKYVPAISGYVMTRRFSEIATALGNMNDAEYYGDASVKIKNAFNNGVIHPDGTMPVDLMGAYVMPLFYDMVDEKHIPQFVRTLERKLAENGGGLDTGFLGTPVILDTLLKYLGPKAAYDLLLRDQSPSWLYEVAQGATTIWESWTAVAQDGTPSAVSLDHYAFGCVDDWMFRNITGIRCTEPGYRRFEICPVLDERITSASRCFESEYGQIRVEWEKDGNSFHMEIEVPCGTECTVMLPNGKSSEVGSGMYTYDCVLIA